MRLCVSVAVVAVALAVVLIISYQPVGHVAIISSIFIVLAAVAVVVVVVAVAVVPTDYLATPSLALSFEL